MHNFQLLIFVFLLGGFAEAVVPKNAAEWNKRQREIWKKNKISENQDIFQHVVTASLSYKKVKIQNSFEIVEVEKQPEPKLSPPKSKYLNLGFSDGELTISQEKLVLKAGETVFLRQGSELQDQGELSLFVRSGERLNWDKDRKSLKALRPGKTEVYLLFEAKMHVLPVIVKGIVQSKPQEEPLVLAKISLNESFPELPEVEGLKGIPGVQIAAAPAALGAAIVSPEEPSWPVLKELQPDVDEVFALAENISQGALAQGESIRRKPKPVKLKHNIEDLQEVGFQLRVIDDLGLPVKGAALEIIGIDETFSSDENGLSRKFFLPRNSFYLVKVQSAGFQPGIARVHGEGLVDVRLLRSAAYSGLERSAVELGFPASGGGSFCGKVLNSVGDPMSGVKILTEDGDYALYQRFNEIDLQADRTGDDGRFCLLGMVPGPLNLNFFRGGSRVDSTVVNIFPGLHFEQDLQLGRRVRLLTKVSSRTRDPGPPFTGRYDWTEAGLVQLLPFGWGEPLEFDGDGGYRGDLNLKQGEAFYLSDDQNYETMLYRYREGAPGLSTTPLWTKDLSQQLRDSAYAAEDLGLPTYDETLGVILVDHGYLRGQDLAGEPLDISVYDANGGKVGLSQLLERRSDSERVLFYNLAAGRYSVVVRSQYGAILALDTALVYDEIISYVRTGSFLRGRR